MRSDKAELRDLTTEECWTLLSEYDVGRVAVNMAGDGPMVVPVNYVLDGQVIVFRSDPGTKVEALRIGPISFELDQINPSAHTGWSVLVTGVAYEATPEEIAHLHVEPWAAGHKGHWVRMIPRQISGRQIELPVYVPDTHGYL